MNIGSGFLGQSANRGITPQTMGDIFGANMVKDATNTMMSVGGQGVVNRGLEQLRQKGTMESNQFNFEREQYRDSQRLLGEQLQFDRNFKREDARLTAQTAQRKIETDAATAQRKIEADAALAAKAAADKLASEERLKVEEKLIKEREEAAARARGEVKKTADEQTITEQGANLTAAENAWHAAMSATGGSYAFTDHIKTNSGKKVRKMNAAGVVEEVDETYSPTAQRMQQHFDSLKAQIDQEVDPLKKAALIKRLTESGQFDYNRTRSMFDDKYVAPSGGGGGGGTGRGGGT